LLYGLTLTVDGQQFGHRRTGAFHSSGGSPGRVGMP
jgi:hypothetical protein